MATELSTTQIALLEAIKASLFGTEPNYPADTDWDEVVKEAKAQTVLGIISPVIPVKDISVEMGKAKYMKLLFEQDKLIKLLDANDIPCVILKGSAAAQYYPKPHLRAMGDVDFLVPKDMFETAIMLLESNGYEYHHGKTKDGKIPEDVRHIGYVKNGIEFELHHHFSSYGFNIDDIIELAIYKKEYRNIDGYNIPVLPDFENGLVLLGHINQHLISQNLGLRQIIDWSIYIHNVTNDGLWNEGFIPFIKKVGLYKLFANTTTMCVKYFGLNNLYLSLETSEDASDLLLEMIFESGNFGNKKIKTTSMSDNDFISYGIYNLKRNGFISYCQDIGLRKWRTCHKYKVLNSIAWIYGLYSIVYRGIPILLKQRNIRNLIDKGRNKYKLFEKLGVESNMKKTR